MQMSFLLWIFLNLQNIFNMSKMSEDTHTPQTNQKTYHLLGICYEWAAILIALIYFLI